jgi:hypothetical protein
MYKKFYICPWCGHKSETGYTGIEFRFDLGEVWLSNGTFVEHKHLHMNMPKPEYLTLAPKVVS